MKESTDFLKDLNGLAIFILFACPNVKIIHLIARKAVELFNSSGLIRHLSF